MFDLTGKAALVTGASGGIGAAIARALHGAGAVVGLSGTRVEPLRALAAELGARHHLVDLSRQTVPISATLVRTDPHTHWEFIPDCVRPYFLQKPNDATTL